jgi:hypothetical protein
MSTTAEFTPIPHEPEFHPADEGFTQIEFPPTYLDFVAARQRFLDRISLGPDVAPAANEELDDTDG